MFEQQPSSQGIAALYQGNPGALQQKIQKDQQANPTMPQDLSQLLALNIVTNENDAAKRQQAMGQLQQMMHQQSAGGAPGQMPTVAQSIQEQAKQKMAAMAQHQAQQAQQAQAQQAQQASEQPPAQGIDNLPAEFKLAGGGIVAFANEGATLDAATRDVMKELGVSARDYIDNPDTAKTVKSLVQERMGTAPAAAEAAAPAATGAAAEAGGLGRLYNMGKMAGRFARGTVPAAIGSEVVGHLGDYKFDLPDKIDTSASGTYNDLKNGEFGRAGTGLLRGLGEAGMDLGSAAANLADYVVPGKAPVSSAYDKFLRENISGLKKPEAQEPAAPKPQVVTQNAPTSQGPGDSVVPRYPQQTPPAATPEVSEMAQRLKQLQGAEKMNVPGAPRPAGAGLPAAAGVGSIPVSPQLAAMQKEDADARKREAMKEMEALAPSSKYSDMAMAEYDRRIKQLEGPKQGMPALMEYLQQIALAPRGVGSLTAGAMGAQKVGELQKQREADMFDLTMKKLDLGFKNEEAQRAFKLETLKTGREVYDKVKDNAFKALQEQGQNDRQASANATSLANAAMQASVSAQGHKLQAEMQLRQLLNAEKRGDRDNAALQLRALSETAKDIGTLLKTPGYIQTPEGKEMLASYKNYLAAIGKMGGVESTGPTLSSTPPTGGKAVGKV